MLCRELLPMTIRACPETASAGECGRLMRDNNIGFVAVVDARGQAVGVLTDRDLAIRVVAEERPPATKVREVMTRPPLVTCSPDEDVRVVEARMARQGKSRAIIVDAAGRCVGVVSVSDIARVEEPARSGQLLHDLSGRESPRAFERPGE